MILEVNDAGEILIPDELVQSSPHTRIEAERTGDALVLKPVPEAPAAPKGRFSDSLPTIEGRLDPSLTFRREEIYGDDAANLFSAAVRDGIAQADRGELVDDEEVRLWLERQERS